MSRFARSLVLIVAVAALAAAADPAAANFSRVGHRAKARACISNMRTIEGACELYMMEKNAADLPPDTTVDRLLAEGYLKSVPTCPAGGTYRVTFRPAKGTAAAQVVVRCSLHGGVDEALQGSAELERAEWNASLRSWGFFFLPFVTLFGLARAAARQRERRLA